MFDNITSFLNAIQTLVIVITLFIVVWQTRQLAKQMKFNTITSTSSHIHTINELLLQDEKLATLVECSQEDALAAIFFGEFELWFLLHQDGMGSHLWWQASENTIDDTLKLKFMRPYWERTKHQHYHSFSQYINQRFSKLGLEKTTFQEVVQST